MFIYINDDTFFGKPCDPWNLITPTGAPRLFFEEQNITCDDSYYSARNVYYSALCNTNGALNKKYGVQPRHVLRHAPFVLYKSVYEKVWIKWREEIYESLLHRFRHSRDILFHYLHHYFVINEGNLYNLTYFMEDLGDLQEDALLFRLEDNDKQLDFTFQQIDEIEPRFFTLNDVFQSPSTSKKVKTYLSRKYPNPSSFELRL